MLHWSDDLTTRSNYTCQVQDARGVICLEASAETGPAEMLDVGHSFGRLWERPYGIVLRARPLDYYEHDLRYERRMPIHVLDNPYSDVLYGTFSQRRTEALEHAAKRGQDVYAEIAKMALEQWDDVDYGRVADVIEVVRQRGHGSDLHLAGLLGMIYRYPDAPGFPGAPVTVICSPWAGAFSSSSRGSASAQRRIAPIRFGSRSDPGVRGTPIGFVA